MNLRTTVDVDNYTLIENYDNVANLTSALKLFLRELPTPLITTEVIDDVRKCGRNLSGKYDQNPLLVQIRKSLEVLDNLAYRVLRYLVLHAKRVADNKGIAYKSFIDFFT